MSSIPPISHIPSMDDMNRRRRESKKRAERLVNKEFQRVLLNEYEPQSTRYEPHSPMFAVTEKRYVLQDGRHFYLFKTIEEFGHWDSKRFDTVAYPGKVADADLLEAKKAHDWFLTQWCPRNNCDAVFIDPFAAV